jgi:DNA-binding transcriptional regulator YdaS (Cro superfamily)
MNRDGNPTVGDTIRTGKLPLRLRWPELKKYITENCPGGQREFAQRIGVSVATVTSWCQGTRGVRHAGLVEPVRNPVLVARLVELLRVTPEQLGVKVDEDELLTAAQVAAAVKFFGGLVPRRAVARMLGEVTTGPETSGVAGFQGRMPDRGHVARPTGPTPKATAGS